MRAATPHCNELGQVRDVQVLTFPCMVRQDNAMGFKTAKAWGHAFADCYLYNPDNVSLTDLLRDPYVVPPPVVP